MRNSSFYDEARSVERSLMAWAPYKESNEVLYEQYEHLSESFDNFMKLLPTVSVEDPIFEDAYEDMCIKYITTERLVSSYDYSAKADIELRDKVKVLYMSFVDPDNGCLNLLKIQASGIPAESVKVIGDLVSESKSVGFWLNSRERDIFNVVKEYVMSDCGC